MFALLSLMVCLAGQPAVCETVTPDYVHPDTGRAPTLFECLGVGDQDIARRWLAEHSALSPDEAGGRRQGGFAYAHVWAGRAAATVVAERVSGLVVAAALVEPPE